MAVDVEQSNASFEGKPIVEVDNVRGSLTNGVDTRKKSWPVLTHDVIEEEPHNDEWKITECVQKSIIHVAISVACKKALRKIN